MWVTVGDAVGRHQPIRVFQGRQNVRHGFPNVLTTKQRKVGGIRAVALHWVEDVVVCQTVRHTRIEVIDTISRGAVNNTRAVGVGGVIGQVHRRGALVSGIHMRQRVMELDQIQRLAFASGDRFATELPAF